MQKSLSFGKTKFDKVSGMQPVEIESRAEKREDRAKGQDRITRQQVRGRQKEQKDKIELMIIIICNSYIAPNPTRLY